MKPYALLAILVVACSPQAPWTASPDSAATRAAAASITASDVYDRVAFLASDELRGRDTPSPGLETAAAWIADELAAFGLEPAGEDGWLQRYPYPQEGLDAARTGLAAVAGATHSFQYGEDFFAWSGAAPSSAVGAVFAGAALPEDAGSLRGRAVVLTLEGLPQPADGGLRLARAARDTVAAMRASAQAAGAAALVLVLEAPYGPTEMAALARVAEVPRRTLGGTAEADRPVPVFFLSRPAAARAFGMAGLDPALLDDSALGTRPVPLSGLAFQLAAPTRVVDDSRPPNVVGVLRGSDPELRDTYVVLSAHMDHVGVGRPDPTGDSIYNGADDDASGTSVLLEVAQAMASLRTPPRRSILFLAVSGEEKGLLGSRWFADHPTVPLDAIVANINLDMVGRNAPDSIVVIGQDYSSMGRTLRQVAGYHEEELGLTVADDIWPEQRFFFRSDHFNFARKEIPALFFFAGTHEDYHAPSDEVEAIDTDKTARVGRLVFYLTYQIAQGDDAPEWDRRGLEEVRRLTRQ